MASGLVSYVQLLSTELALKAIEQQQERSASPLPTELDQPDDSTVAGASGEPAPLPSAPLLSLVPETPESEDDITGAPFMRSLKAWIGELSADQASAHQGDALAQALTCGTLRIFDPVEGVAITAWDVSGERPQAIERDEINAVGWSQFLKQRVKRGDAGYAKDADGNYMDVVSGQNAYFGAVGSRFYYLTWPKMSSEA